MVLSVAMSTILSEPRAWNSFRAKMTVTLAVRFKCKLSAVFNIGRFHLRAENVVHCVQKLLK